MTCICPSHKYTCSADNVARMAWDSENSNYEDFEIISYTVQDRSEPDIINKYGLQVQFLRTEVNSMFLSNFTSHLLVIEPETWNGSNVTCEANIVQINDTFPITICITGNILCWCMDLVKIIFNRSCIITY